MNLYFLISINSDGTGTIYESLQPFSNVVAGVAQLLPPEFLNISGFNNLEQNNPTLLFGLGWAGRPDLGFWIANIATKPTTTYYKKITTTNTVNNSNKTVDVTYTEVELTPVEIELKNKKMKSSYVPVRDSYLKLTDFTQLSDAPITEQAKSDFLIFRQQLRSMFDISDYSQLAWPSIPTSAPNIVIPPFPTIDFS